MTAVLLIWFFAKVRFAEVPEQIEVPRQTVVIRQFTRPRR